jgi:hypothetical protein
MLSITRRWHSPCLAFLRVCTGHLYLSLLHVLSTFPLHLTLYRRQGLDVVVLKKLYCSVAQFIEPLGSIVLWAK